MNQQNLPNNYKMQNISVFILHNMSVMLIVHLSIFFIWMVITTWKWIFKNKSQSFQKLFFFFHFYLMIFFYLLSLMKIFVFSFINFRNPYLIHSYFKVCFGLSIIYISIFVLFWLYSFYMIQFKSATMV